MTRRPRRAATVNLKAAIAVILALSVARARADGVSAVAEPHYTETQGDYTDQANNTTHTHNQLLSQDYRLSLSKALTPGLRFDGTGTLTDTMALGPAAVESGTRATMLGTSLGFGDRLLGGNASYSHNEARDKAFSSAGTQLNDVYGLTLGWAPEGLPSLTLRLNRSDMYDQSRKQTNATSDGVTMNTRYVPEGRQFRVDGSASYAGTTDHVNLASTSTYGGSLTAGWDDKIFGGRTNAAVTYSGAGSSTETVATGEGGVVSTQQTPAPGAGLSFIDDVAGTPETTALDHNAALVDGNTQLGAGIDLGYAAGPPGDTRIREMGAEFADTRTPVNVVYVWVDRALQASVVSALSTTWSVYRSNDNVTWMPVMRAGPVVVPPFDNRFEVPIEETAARYLKVVARPLPIGITVDPKYQHLFVTEVQFFRRSMAADQRGRISSMVNQVGVAARTPITLVQGLAHDISGVVRRTDAFGVSAAPGVTSWSVANGLQLTRKLAPTLTWNSRLLRNDSYDGAHKYDGAFMWGSSLSARPLPTLTHTLSYTGSFHHGTDGMSVENAATLFNRAQIYSWLGLTTQAGYSMGRTADGVDTHGAQLGATGDIVPHRTFRLSGGWQLRRTVTGVGENRTQTVNAAASFSPTEATSVSASVVRIIEGARPTTLGGLSLAMSPFQGGAVQLRFNASRSIDTTAETTSNVVSPGLRWNIRPGWSADVGYSWVKMDGPVSRSNMRTLDASLVASLL
jgi:hypothetical protein